MGAVAWAIRQRPVSHPAHRTGRADFRHPALRLASQQGTRNNSRIASVRCTVCFFLRLAIQLSLKNPDHSRCLQAHRQSPSPRLLRKRTRSQGPLLSRHCPASTLIRPCPTPASAAACRDVEAAALAPNGSPPITRTTFPTCRAHYPGGSSGCACRLLPRSCSLPQMAGGSASALSLSRPAQASLALRPAGLLSRP
jgi:hypothetical protein